MKMRKLLFAVAATTCRASAAIGAASAQAGPMPEFGLYATVNGSGMHEFELSGYSCETRDLIYFTGTGEPIGSMYTETIEGQLNKMTGKFSFSSEYSPGGYSWGASGTATHDMYSDDMSFTASKVSGTAVVSVTGTFVDVPPCSHGQYVSGARAAGVSKSEFKEIVKDKSLFGPYPMPG